MAKNPLVMKKVASPKMQTPERQSMGILDDFKTGKVSITKESYTQTFKMPTGAVNGYVLTTDANGVGTWQEAPSYWWLDTTTAQFDAMTKSESSGNYEIETYTDNLKITDGQLELGNAYSDRFTCADADATTWKWTYGESGTVAGCEGDINTTTAGKLYLKVNPNDVESVAWVQGRTLTGDFDVQVDFSGYTHGATYDNYLGLVIYDGTSPWQANHVSMLRTTENVGQDQYYSAADVDGTWTQLVTTDTSGKLRLTREIVGANVTFKWYYWSAGAWVLLETVVRAIATYPWVDDDLKIGLSMIATNGVDDVIMNFDDFKVNSGTLTSTTHRTTGNIKSEKFKMPASSKLNAMTITLTGASATYYVDKVEILSSADAVLSTSNTNITSNGANVVGDWSTALNTITQDFKYKIYLAGDGAGSCAVTDVKMSFKK